MKHINHNVIATFGVAQVTDNPTMKHIIEIAAVAMALNDIITYIVEVDDTCKYEHDQIVGIIVDGVRVRCKDYDELFKTYGVDGEIVMEHFDFPLGEILCRL